MSVYILGSGAISPQKTWDAGALPSSPAGYSGDRLTCAEPDYEAFMDPKQMRRMSRVMKMGVASALIALRDAGVPAPDGIITGTGYGCLADTAQFLSKMIDNDEQALNPTPFIQSTHNTIGSQIAMMLSCQAYNQTYTHGPFSFEHALQDAMLQVWENPGRNILTGGVDEITDVSHRIQRRFGIFRKHCGNTLDLFAGSGRGTVNGEGSAFFVLSGRRIDGSVCIADLSTLYKPGKNELVHEIRRLVGAHENDPDVILLGKSGWREHDIVLDELSRSLFPSSSLGAFKHLCGEYPVAAAFACWLGYSVIREQKIPAAVLLHDARRAPRRILIFNQYFGTHYSLILLKAC